MTACCLVYNAETWLARIWSINILQNLQNSSTNNAHKYIEINPLNAKLNPICPLLALIGAHHILHISR